MFPPGLIPGMVRKRQIGSGVPYSPMSPLDVPTSIPPTNATEEYIQRRVAKFFRIIGEKDPLAPAEGAAEEEADGREDEPEADVVNAASASRGILGKGRGHGREWREGRERDAFPLRAARERGEGDRERGRVGGGAREEHSPPRGAVGLGMPPAAMEVDPETGMLPDGSVLEKPGLGGARLGLGAAVDPNENTQYDDVYGSFRKMLSSSYHQSISVRASKKYEHT